jgi:DNA-binding NarL/FixJ family response regulator
MKDDPMLFAGWVAPVTGAGHGIRAATARLLAGLGTADAVSSRHDAAAAPPAVDQMADVTAEPGPVDVLIFNAAAIGRAAKAPFLQMSRDARRRLGDDRLGQLTRRERDVLALMAEGRSNQAIARRLFVTEHTIEKHIKNIFATLRLPSSADDHRRVLAVVAFLNAQ